MDISFCISTDLSDNAIDRIKKIIESIETQNIPNYEILIIAETAHNNRYNNMPKVKYIYFDADKHKKWITKKKNILAYNAQYNNIVMMHDYFLFDSSWYRNFMGFGDDWDVCSNAQLLQNGNRHWLDWTVWDDPKFMRYTGLCYNNWSRTQFMYISGAYYLIKKNVAIDHPLNENLVWGQEEDVEWSLRIRNKYIIKCNEKSIVKHCKPHRDLNYKTYRFENCQ